MDVQHKTKSIAVLGKSAMDLIFTGSPATRRSRVSNACTSIDFLPGGSALNVACAARYFDIDVSLYTRLGTDIFSAAIQDVCSRHNIKLVNLGASHADDFETPRIAVFLDDNHERTFEAGRNGRLEITSGHITKDVISSVASHRVAVFDGLMPKAGFAFHEMGSVLKSIRRENPDIILAGDVIAVSETTGGEWRKSIESHLASYDWFLPSEDELVQMTSDVFDESEIRLMDTPPNYIERADWMLNEYPNLKVVGVKLNALGAIVCRRSDEGVATSAFDVAFRPDVVDKTGAGDSWVGAFLAGALLNETSDNLPSFDAAGKYGNAAASYCIRYLGAVTWCDQVPRDEMERTLDSIKTTAIPFR